MAVREEIIQRISGFGGKLRIRSALNPMLWLCALVAPVLCFAAFFLTPYRVISMKLLFICRRDCMHGARVFHSFVH